MRPRTRRPFHAHVVSCNRVCKLPLHVVFASRFVWRPEAVSTRGTGHCDKNEYAELRDKVQRKADDSTVPAPMKRPAAAAAIKDLEPTPSKRAAGAINNAEVDNEWGLDDDIQSTRASLRQLTPQQKSMKALRACFARCNKLSYDAKLKITQLGKARLQSYLFGFVARSHDCCLSCLYDYTCARRSSAASS